MAKLDIASDSGSEDFGFESLRAGHKTMSSLIQTESLRVGLFMSNLEIRNSIKIILLNPENKILLIGTDDSSIKDKDGGYNGRFWQMIGGKIEEGEDVITAAQRELFEETGLSANDVQFGKIVWKGELVLVMGGIETLIKQRFIIAKTTKTSVTMENLTPEEKPIAKSLKWFSVEEIKNSSEIVYPVGLDEYLSDLLQNGVPDKSINIILNRKPKI